MRRRSPARTRGFAPHGPCTINHRRLEHGADDPPDFFAVTPSHAPSDPILLPPGASIRHLGSHRERAGPRLDRRGPGQRRGWDLNPRTSYPVTSLAGKPDRPDSGTSPCCAADRTQPGTPWPPTMPSGAVAERTNAPVLKTGDPQGSEGSNPSRSAKGCRSHNGRAELVRFEPSGIPGSPSRCAFIGEDGGHGAATGDRGGRSGPR